MLVLFCIFAYCAHRMRKSYAYNNVAIYCLLSAVYDKCTLSSIFIEFIHINRAIKEFCNFYQYSKKF